MKSTTGTIPVAYAMAFGGVATGEQKLSDAPIVAGTMRKSGSECPMCREMDEAMGRSSAATATFDVINQSVQRAVIQVTRRMLAAGGSSPMPSA